MYNVVIYYLVPDTGEIKYQTIYGVFLYPEVCDWLLKYPNLKKFDVYKNDRKVKEDEK